MIQAWCAFLPCIILQLSKLHIGSITMLDIKSVRRVIDIWVLSYPHTQYLACTRHMKLEGDELYVYIKPDDWQRFHKRKTQLVASRTKMQQALESCYNLPMTPSFLHQKSASSCIQFFCHSSLAASKLGAKSAHETMQALFRSKKMLSSSSWKLRFLPRKNQMQSSVVSNKNVRVFEEILDLKKSWTTTNFHGILFQNWWGNSGFPSDSNPAIPSPHLRPAIPMLMAFIVSRSMLCFEERYAAKKNARSPFSCNLSLTISTKKIWQFWSRFVHFSSVFSDFSPGPGFIAKKNVPHRIFERCIAGFHLFFWPQKPR